jgi:hypothetical protein
MVPINPVTVIVVDPDTQMAGAVADAVPPTEVGFIVTRADELFADVHAPLVITAR